MSSEIRKDFRLAFIVFILITVVFMFFTLSFVQIMEHRDMLFFIVMSIVLGYLYIELLRNLKELSDSIKKNEDLA